MTRQIPCPECGADQAPELLRCNNCHAFMHDTSPWRSDHNLLAIPIALVLGFFLLLTTYIEGSPTQQVLGDFISQIIVIIGIYAIVMMITKLHATSRQIAAFRLVRQACNNMEGDWHGRLETLRRKFEENGLGAFNTLLSYTRLEWLAETAKLPEASRGIMVDSLRHHSETDWEALDSAFATSRYLVWFLPSAGFLGTVWGMTKALQGFRTAVEKGGEMAFNSGLHDTLEGLGMAFYTTLVGLAMVIPVFFLALIARRRAQGFLERLDKFFIRLSAAVMTPSTETEEPVTVDPISMEALPSRPDAIDAAAEEEGPTPDLSSPLGESSTMLSKDDADAPAKPI